MHKQSASIIKYEPMLLDGKICEPRQRAPLLKAINDVNEMCGGDRISVWHLVL